LNTDLEKMLNLFCDYAFRKNLSKRTILKIVMIFVSVQQHFKNDGIVIKLFHINPKLQLSRFVVNWATVNVGNLLDDRRTQKVKVVIGFAANRVG
jgi:hypothetical protein